MAGQPSVIRFGVFEVNLTTGELRKNGSRVKLQEQPFQLLVTLLKRPGEMVTKEELKERLWADDTFVDFDHSLSTAVNKIREALGDSAASPRFIETVPRKGYRFIGAAGMPHGEAAEVAAQAPKATLGSRRWWAWGLAGTAFVVLAFFGIGKWKGESGDRPSNVPEANEYYRMALAIAQSHDHAQTLSLLQKALALDPKFARARAEYAFFVFLNFLDGVSDDASVLYVAEEQLQQALRDNPKSARGHAALAAIYLSQGKKEDAARELAAAQAPYPDLFGLNWRFNYHWMNGDSDEAERIAKSMVERAPAFIPGRMHLAEIERERGNLQTALREANKILEQDPRHPYGLLPKVRIQIDSGDLAGARETLELIPPQRRADLNVQLMNALLLAVEAKRQPALAALNDQVVSFASKRIFWTSCLAEFHAVLGDSSAALDWLERAVRGGDERAEWFQRDPLLANLRSSERFKQIQNMISFRRQRRR